MTDDNALFSVTTEGHMRATAVAAVTRRSDAYMTIQDLLYLEVMGVSTQIKAIIAAVHTRGTISSGFSHWDDWKAPKGMKFSAVTEKIVGRQYKATIFPKPEGGLFLFPQMMPGYRPITAEAWEKVEEEKVQPWHLLAQVIASRTIYPVKQEWAIDLWEAARELRAVSSLEVHGYIPWAYWVNGSKLADVIGQVAAKRMP